MIRNRYKIDEKGNAFLVLVLVVVFVGVAAVGWRVVAFNNQNKKANTAAMQSSSTTQTAQTTTPAATIGSGTDNSSLSSDLSSVNTSIGQESSAGNSANAAVNDQQSEVAVPTN